MVPAGEDDTSTEQLLPVYFFFSSVVHVVKPWIEKVWCWLWELVADFVLEMAVSAASIYLFTGTGMSEMYFRARDQRSATAHNIVVSRVAPGAKLLLTPSLLVEIVGVRPYWCPRALETERRGTLFSGCCEGSCVVPD